MEKFKIDLFEKETGELFPSFQKLNQTDCNICYQYFRKNIKVLKFRIWNSSRLSILSKCSQSLVILNNLDG